VAIGVAITAPLPAQTLEKDIVTEGITGTRVQSVASIQGKRWALLVGIANYPSSEEFEIQQLKAPVKDVNALAAFLKDPKRGDFDSDHVFTLTDEKATRREILITFNDIARRATPEDLVLFYFSGHGYRPSDSEITYLIPFDHDMRDLDITCINFDDLAKKIREMEASKVVVILDACHAGGVKPTGARAAASAGLVQRYLEAFQKSEGRALLLSSDESEVSWETKENGIFTLFLLEGLNGKADTNGDGIVTFTEVALHVEDTVPKFTRENFPQVQRPTRRYEFGQVRGDIPLALNLTAHEAFRQKHQDLLDKRTGAILRASLAGLDEVLKEFSLQVAQSAHRKTINGEQLTEQESMLLPELDTLQAGKLTVADYIVRTRAIYRLGSGVSLTHLQIAVTPSDATVMLTPANTPNRVITPSSPNAYRVAQGRYSLSAQRPGYAPNSRELTLGKKSESVTMTLEKLMGTLRLNVTPADATVKITPLSLAAPDAEISASKDIRVQPTVGRKFPIGTYRVTAEKDGYQPVTKEPVEITTNVPTRVTLTLNPKLATIAAPNLPDGIRVFVDGASVTLPHKLPPGAHSIRLERNGFKPVEMSETLKPAQTLSLRPQWIPIKPPMFKPSKGIPRGVAFAASLVVPGLGQHLQKRHVRGGIYEAVTIGAGIAALWATSYYRKTLDDYIYVRVRLVTEAPEQTELTSEIRTLLAEQEDAYNKAKSARMLAIATQIVFGAVWGINVLDAVTKPTRQKDGIAIEAQPTSDGGRILVSMKF